MENREIKHKNIFLVYLFSFITFGIYWLVWTVKSKRDLNALGADIPTSWLLMVPIANFYWLYRYSEGYAKVSKNGSSVLWFLVFAIFGFVTPFLVQSTINDHSNGHSGELSNAHAA